VLGMEVAEDGQEIHGRREDLHRAHGQGAA
jgi:hypothetical protein